MYQDLTGKQFGRLTVIKRIRNKGAFRQWLCRCQCGSKVKLLSHHLTTGNTQSCGCQKAEKARATCLARATHGDNRRGQYVPEYKAWAEMRYRCFNENGPAYAEYGGRGITVCEEWDKYENFLADMGRKPTPDLQLDRIDNDGDYRPGNCRWATRKQQCQNRRTPRRAHLRGKKHKRRKC